MLNHIQTVIINVSLGFYQICKVLWTLSPLYPALKVASFLEELAAPQGEGERRGKEGCREYRAHVVSVCPSPQLMHLKLGK